MKLTPTVGKPNIELRSGSKLGCLSDVNRCPKGWQQQGSLCIATSSYLGACKPRTPLFDMGMEEKLAFARYCQVEFHCQEDCIQNFKSSCPSLWRQVSGSVCEAPQNYVGKCSHRVQTDTMTDQDKMEFGLMCGARWPCASPVGHVYSDVCPEGWTMLFGQTCRAPADYQGPCRTFARMASLATSDKQAFEVACGVNWPSRGAQCEADYSAQCPSGWQEHHKKYISASISATSPIGPMMKAPFANLYEGV